jgi:oligoribonuclease
MIYVSIDLETTGLNPERNQILEFGAVIEDTNNILPVSELPTFQVYIDNGEEIIGNMYALQMNHVILKRIATKEEGFTYIKPDELGEEFFGFLQDNGFEARKDSITINVAGKNFGTFDLNFLNNCPIFNESVHIRQCIIDPAIFYVNWSEDKTLPNLEEFKTRAKMPGIITHNTVEDAIDVINVLRPFYTK